MLPAAWHQPPGRSLCLAPHSVHTGEQNSYSAHTRLGLLLRPPIDHMEPSQRQEKMWSDPGTDIISQELTLVQT